jgi:hypothetical protein
MSRSPDFDLRRQKGAGIQLDPEQIVDRRGELDTRQALNRDVACDAVAGVRSSSASIHAANESISR